MKSLSRDLDFLFHEDVRRIFDNFTSLFNIRIAFFSLDGKELEVGENRLVCDYCRSLRQIPGAAEACLEEDRQALLRALESRRLETYTCHGGMIEAVKPILQEQRVIGFVMIGQIREENSPPARWLMKRGERYDRLRLTELYRRQPCFRRAEFPKILAIFSDLMDLLVAQHKIHQRRSDPLDDFIDWVKTHPSQRVTLQTAVERVPLSSSRISHLCKERYGLSFTETVRRIKMEKACFLLTRFPEKTVQEVAWSVGYHDSQYFSRQFRNSLGLSPNQYKKQQNRPH